MSVPGLSRRRLVPVSGLPVQLAMAVVGVGAIIVPPLAAGWYGRAALLGWGYQLLVGLGLVLALRAVVAGDPGWPAGGGVAALASRTLASRPAASGAVAGPAGRAVRWCYIVGITAGQMVVAAVAGALVSYALGAPVGLVAAVGTVLAGAGLAYAGWRPPPGLATAGAVGVLVYVAVSARAGAPVAVLDGLALDGRTPLVYTSAGGALVEVGEVAFLLLFAFVGWEALLPLAGGRGGAGRAAAVAGVVLVAMVYFAAAVGATTGATAPGAGGAGVRVLAGLAALLCTLACARNLVTLTVLAGAGRRARHRSAVLCGAAAATGAALVHLDVVGVRDLLTVPNVMALVIFLTAAGTAAVRTRGGARIWAGFAFAGYLFLVPFAGPALLLPLLVLLACVLVRPSRSMPCR